LWNSSISLVGYEYWIVSRQKNYWLLTTWKLPK
jgi:hypothetical protein